MLEALNVACVVAPVLITVWLVVMAILHGRAQMLLCMECEQCVAVCPVSRKAGSNFRGPNVLMVASKTGDIEEAIQNGALLCNECGACQRVCPRGLAPYLELRTWRKKHGIVQEKVKQSRQDRHICTDIPLPVPSGQECEVVQED